LIQKNSTIYDLRQIQNHLLEFEQRLKSSFKISDSLLNFFKSKKNFRIKADLTTFSNKKLHNKVKKSTRLDIEKELALVSISKNLNIGDLKKLLGKPEIGTKKFTPLSKKKAPAKNQKSKIKDQTVRWLSLTEEELIYELNDLKRYPDPRSLKLAADSILKPNEKRMRSRTKILKAIIDRTSEEKAITHLGR